MKFSTLSSEVLLRGRVFTIRRDLVQIEDGRTTHFDIVEHRGSVVILPVDAEGHLLFVRQYRHAVGMEILELPAGVLEEGETPLACAQREIREETGLAAREWVKMGTFYLAPGYSTELMHVYLAKDLYTSPLNPDEYEFLQLERISLGEVAELARRGGLPDAKTLAALYLAGPYLNPFSQK